MLGRLIIIAFPFLIQVLRKMRPRNWQQRVILIVLIGALGYANEEFGRFSVFSDRVIDGDTFVMEREKIRIWGIDTPERGQFGYLPAGDYLRKIIDSNQLQCHFKKRDVYRRALMTCRLENGNDLGAQMVSSGWARDFTKYSNGYYKKQESQAREKHLGLWAQQK